MSALEDLLIDRTDVALDIYLSDVSPRQFRMDIQELMAESTDDGVLDKAIKLLESCKSLEAGK